RTAPFALVQENRPTAPLGKVGFPIVVKSGDFLHVELAQEGLLLIDPSLTIARVCRTPAELKALWKEALVTAGAGQKVEEWHGLYNAVFEGVRPMTDDEIGEISNLEITGLKMRTVRVRLGHLAAMILLRNTALEMMQAQRKDMADLDALKGDMAIRGYRELIRPHMKDEGFPLRRVEVDDSVKSAFQMKVSLTQAFDEDFLHSR